MFNCSFFEVFFALLRTPDAAGNEMSIGDTSSTKISDMLKTPSSSGIHQNLKKICDDSDVDTPEKTLMVEKQENSSSTTSMKFVRGTENHWPLCCHTCVLLAMQRQRLS